MEKNQFVFRMVVVIVFGLLFVTAAFMQGKSHPADQSKRHSAIWTVISILSAIVSIFFAVKAILVLQNILQFPLQGESTSVMVQGVPHRISMTYSQSCCINLLIITFLLASVSSYFSSFRRSNSKCIAKAVKVLNFGIAYNVMMEIAFINYYNVGEIFYTMVIFSILVWSVSIIRKYGCKNE